MVWTLGARALATQAAPRARPVRASRRIGALVALTCAGAGATYWLRRNDAPPVPPGGAPSLDELRARRLAALPAPGGAPPP